MRNDKIDIVHNEDPVSSISADAEVDSELAERVSEILHGDHLIDTAKISVRVLNRTVYLEGAVNSENERNMAYQDTINIFGVRNVVNYLTFPCPYLRGNRM
ncbi:BON domain-containing protein [Dyadobacter sp. 22481]|uniref:BON domain-containing protein n=1 Tax=Dyadobacter sp. 22481 TaxID=3453926 RepID=UPI003F8372A7